MLIDKITWVEAARNLTIDRIMKSPGYNGRGESIQMLRTINVANVSTAFKKKKKKNQFHLDFDSFYGDPEIVFLVDFESLMKLGRGV